VDGVGLVKYLGRYLVRRELAYILIAGTAIVLGLRTQHAAGSQFFAVLDHVRHALGL
jgi:hypothetical protein